MRLEPLRANPGLVARGWGVQEVIKGLVGTFPPGPWFNYVHAAPGPENELEALYDGQRAKAAGTGDDVRLEYLRAQSDPANVHGMCEDYRASASIDLTHDAADLATKIACPVLALWGAKAPMGRLYDVLAIWRERAAQVSGKGMPAGHTIQEDDPAGTLAEIRAFLQL